MFKINIAFQFKFQLSTEKMTDKEIVNIDMDEESLCQQVPPEQETEP